MELPFSKCPVILEKPNAPNRALECYLIQESSLSHTGCWVAYSLGFPKHCASGSTQTVVSRTKVQSNRAREANSGVMPPNTCAYTGSKKDTRSETLYYTIMYYDFGIPQEIRYNFETLSMAAHSTSVIGLTAAFCSLKI